jgi:hypothetical protein
MRYESKTESITKEFQIIIEKLKEKYKQTKFIHHLGYNEIINEISLKTYSPKYQVETILKILLENEDLEEIRELRLSRKLINEINKQFEIKISSTVKDDLKKVGL